MQVLTKSLSEGVSFFFSLIFENGTVCGIDFAKIALCIMDVKVSVPLVSLAYNAQSRVKQLGKIGSVAINGNQLDIAAVVAVAKSVHPVLFFWESHELTRSGDMTACL